MINLVIVLKGGPTSGWYAPPKGTHSGEEHEKVGSGKATATGGKKKEAPVVAAESYKHVEFSEVTPKHKEKIVGILRKHGVPDDHVKGLTITTRMPSNYKAVGGDWIDRTGATVNGVYFQGAARGGTGVIHISPGTLRYRGATLVHEVGHHKMRRYSLDVGLGRDWDLVKGRLTFAASTIRDMPDRSRRKLGLREYSGRNYKEFFADSYSSSLIGTESQQKALRSFCKTMRIDFEEAFG